MVKHLPAMWETWVRSLGWEDLLEKEMQSIPVLLPGESQGQRSLVGCSPWGRKESDMTERLHFTSLHFPQILNVINTMIICRDYIKAETFNIIGVCISVHSAIKKKKKTEIYNR